jgi:hypothetical protein
MRSNRGYRNKVVRKIVNICDKKKKKGNKDAAGQQNTCNEVYNKNKEFV